jgi:hypothetical protein
MRYEERLRRLALHDPEGIEEPPRSEDESVPLDSKTLALARIAALVAVGGEVPSYSELVDSAVSAGASPSETVDVLVGVIEIVGLPRIVDAAPKLALALGYDIDEALHGRGEPH